MRAFTFFSFIAVASAGSGYFYGKPGKCQTSCATSGSASDLSVSPAQSGIDYVRSGDSSRRIGVSSGRYVRPIGPRAGNYFGFNNGGGSHSPIRLSQDQAIDESVNKEFFTFSIPGDNYSNVEAARRVAKTIKKKLRVVFIKAPENNAATNAAFQLAKQVIQDKTHIYVLSRQPDFPELVTEVQMLGESFRQPPEVKFIKYRTPQDAVNAQRLIQQQYEAMGGSSRTINGGVAPVLNYQNGFVNNGLAQQGTASKTFTQPAVLDLPILNQAQGFGESVSQNRLNQFGQYRRPQAQNFNQQKFSFNDLDGLSNFVNKGAIPAVSFSSAKTLPGKAGDQSNKEREETETFIYVLSKEPNIEEVVDKFRELMESARLRPEVHFVKYRTPQEAIDAQQFIQQQYDALGGTSTSDI